MKRILIIGVALFASTLALAGSASARLGMAPLAAQDDAVIQVEGRPRTWSRPYGPRRARPPLRLGPRPRTSLRLAPSSLSRH